MKLRGRFRFVHACPDSTYEDMRAMLDTDEPVSRRTLSYHVGSEQLRDIERWLGYSRELPMSRDWAVGYHRGIYRGVPAYWFRWSGMEYIFTLDGKLGPSLEYR